MTEEQKLVDQFLEDCKKFNQPLDITSMNGWLWFTCPAQMRFKVRPILEAIIKTSQAPRLTAGRRGRAS